MTFTELGKKEDHSCYVCFDDWAFERRRCWQRQFNELLIQYLVKQEAAQAPQTKETTHD